ncbi:TlpA family protein disulfide reductase [Streptomyces sp. AJS327]|uniref:TlpA family protein disulfide reductase n=1 Tax=Streptomyces sp. AJS327 TaxID=2545265 RepID=UPI0015DDBD1E|nr:TlpA disulfide reductase family protein [Streptomyces sp. AJS327]MBA0053879.1 TlpA family protein disulfide reductase [Streptomyces sp. AJS327]
MSQSRAPRRRLAALFATVAAGALALTGCGAGETGSASGDTKFVQGTGELTKVAKGDRKKAPDIEGETLDGDTLKLKEYRGKVVVLNVWGSWCAPCRAEAPNLAKVAKDTKDRGVEFVGLNTRDPDKAPALAFERNFNVDYPSIYDPSGKQILRFPKYSLSLQTIPSTAILDRKGRIAVRALKELSEKELRDAIEPLIKEK